MKLDIRNKDGKQVELVEGMWYVGVNWNQPVYLNNKAQFSNEHGEPLGMEAIIGRDNAGRCDYGEIAQYVGEGEFYDEGCDEPTRMQDYEYIIESHMGRIAA